MRPCDGCSWASPRAGGSTITAPFAVMSDAAASGGACISFDGGGPIELDTADCTYGPAWHWAALRIGVMCPALAEPMPLSVGAGTHVLDFSSREGQSIVDRVELATDAAYVPSG